MQSFILDRHTDPSNPVMKVTQDDKIPVYDDQAAANADLANLAVGQFIVTKEVSVRENTIFNTIYPIGVTYVQYPGQKSPNELWSSISTWEEIDYSGAFFRASGGNADSFIAEGGTLTKQKAQLPNIHAQFGFNNNAINGTWGNGALSNTYTDHGGGVSGGSSTVWRNYSSTIWNFSASNSSASSDHLGDNVYTNNGETRPSNFTIKIWKRTA